MSLEGHTGYSEDKRWQGGGRVQIWHQGIVQEAAAVIQAGDDGTWEWAIGSGDGER